MSVISGFFNYHAFAWDYQVRSYFPIFVLSLSSHLHGAPSHLPHLQVMAPGISTVKLLPSVWALCENVDDTIARHDSHGVEQKFWLAVKCLPQETSPWHFQTWTETRYTQITRTCASSRELETCGPSINLYWIEWNIIGFIVHNKVRGGTHSLMFPSWNCLWFSPLAKWPHQPVCFVVWRGWKPQNESKGSHGLGIILLSFPRYLFLSSQWGAGKTAHLERLRCFWVSPALKFFRGHSVANHCHFPFCSNDSQIGFGYVVMQNQFFNAIIISCSEEIENNSINNKLSLLTRVSKSYAYDVSRWKRCSIC